MIQKTVLSVIVLTLFLFGHIQTYDPQYAFHIPFLTKNNYQASLDESLDSEDNATNYINGSDH